MNDAVPSLRRNISWSFVGNLVFAASQWALISLFAKTLGAEAVGRYALALAIVSPVFVLGNLNLRAVQSTDVREEYQFADYFSLRILTSGLAAAIVIALALSFDFADLTTFAILAVAGVKVFESLADVSFGLFQKQEQMRTIAISLITRSLAFVILAIIAVAIFDSLSHALIAILLAYAGNYLLVDLPKTRASAARGQAAITVRFSRPLAALFLTSLPLGFTVFCNVMYQSVPRYFVEHESGLAALGVYAGVMYFMMVGATVVNAVGQSATPRLARLYHDSREDFMHLLKRLLLAGVAIGATGIGVAWGAGAVILELVYSERFADGAALFVAVMVMSTFVYLSAFLGSALTAIRAFTVQARIGGACLVILPLACWVAVPALGAMGAVAALTFVYVLKCSLEAIALREGVRAPAAA